MPRAQLRNAGTGAPHSSAARGRFYALEVHAEWAGAVPASCWLSPGRDRGKGLWSGLSPWPPCRSWGGGGAGQRPAWLLWVFSDFWEGSRGHRCLWEGSYLSKQVPRRGHRKKVLSGARAPLIPSLPTSRGRHGDGWAWAPVPWTRAALLGINGAATSQGSGRAAPSPRLPWRN